MSNSKIHGREPRYNETSRYGEQILQSIILHNSSLFLAPRGPEQALYEPNKAPVMHASSPLALRYIEVTGLASLSGHGEKKLELERGVRPHFVLPRYKSRV